MTIFRYKKNNKLYIIYHVKPLKETGSYHEAVPYLWKGKTLKNINLSMFTGVGER